MVFFSFVKDRALNNTLQLGIGGMEFAQIKKGCREKLGRLHCKVIFFPSTQIGDWQDFLPFSTALKH